jgi:hypothetical protein
VRELDVFDLSAQKINLLDDRTSVYTSLVCTVHDIEVIEDLLDVSSGCPCKALSTRSKSEPSTSFP